MRWYILRTLLHKEALRHLANRGGIVLGLLLLGMALLLSFGKANNQGGIMPAEVQACFLLVRTEDNGDKPFQDWVRYLRQHIPPEWKDHLHFRRTPTQISVDAAGKPLLEGTAASIQLLPLAPAQAGQPPQYVVRFSYPGEDPNIIAPFEAWFWRETRAYYWDAALKSAPSVAAVGPVFTDERERLHGSADTRSLLATALVLFALFLPCMYLLPCMTCEERERGVMLAQALSPASPLEILAAKFLFYPVAGVGLGAAIAGVYHPPALLSPFFWLTMFALAISWLGIGMTLASLARSQRFASLGAMCYLIILCLYMLTVQSTGFWPLMWILIEYHSPLLLQHALSDSVNWFHWLHLAALVVLAGVWSLTAVVLFRQRGWQ